MSSTALGSAGRGQWARGSGRGRRIGLLGLLPPAQERPLTTCGQGAQLTSPPTATAPADPCSPPAPSPTIRPPCSFLSGCQPRAAAPPLAWHPRQPWLAAADSAGRVQVVELPAAAPSGGGGRPAAAAGGGRSEVLVLGAAEGLGGAGGGGGGCCCRAVLAHEAVQPQVGGRGWWGCNGAGAAKAGVRGAGCVHKAVTR